MMASKAARQVAELTATLHAISRSQAIIEFAPDGTILTANDNFLRVVGYSLHEVKGRHHALFMPAGESDTPAYRAFWARLASGEFQTAEFRRVGRDGREIWLQASYNPVLDGSGKPFKIIKIATDITRTRLENAYTAGQIEAIRRSQAVIEFDPDGTILDANENFLRLTGYSLPEIVGRRHTMFVRPEERDSPAYRAFWDALRRGTFQVAEFRRIGKGGRDIWLQGAYNPILGPDGKPLKVVKFAAEVTAARMERANYEGQVQAIRRSQAVIEFDLEGRVLDANDLFQELMGYTLADIKGQHHSMFMPPAERASAEYKAFWQALSQGESRSGEYCRLARNGREVWLRATYNAIRDLDGRPYKIVKFAIDITVQAKAREGYAELVQSVAAGAHQLDGSISEISATMLRSRETAAEATRRLAAADESTRRLSDAVLAMGRIVGLIAGIARQINLLALNATIESARAGEAGRGFAVVANEVKTLAKQAQTATEEITREIQGVQAVSTNVVETLSAIGEAMTAVGDFVVSTTAAVEEQSTVTREISSNMQSAAAQGSRLWAA